MRPIPWIIRLALFAVGAGVGMLHYTPPSTQPIILEIYVDSAPAPAAYMEARANSGELPCTVPVKNLVAQR